MDRLDELRFCQEGWLDCYSLFFRWRRGWFCGWLNGGEGLPIGWGWVGGVEKEIKSKRGHVGKASEEKKEK